MRTQLFISTTPKIGLASHCEAPAERGPKQSVPSTDIKRIASLPTASRNDRRESLYFHCLWCPDVSGHGAYPAGGHLFRAKSRKRRRDLAYPTSTRETDALRRCSSGIGSPAFFKASMYPRIASLAFSNASAFVRPWVTQPGKAGTITE